MKSGIKISNHTKMSISESVIEYSEPEIVYIPLINYNGECEALVEVGDHVLKGSVIGKRKDKIELPIHASVSGKVISTCEKWYLNGEKVKCIAIKNDYHEKQINMTGAKQKMNSYTKEDFIDVLKDCAVVGMGGSDFPTYLKYKEDLNTIIVNAVECEAYMTSDLMLVKLKAEEILETIDAVMEINKINKCFIAIKEGNHQMSKALSKYLGTYPNIKLVTVRNIYPMGWEKLLIKELLKIDYEKFPSEKGIVVDNVSTIYAMYKALKYNRPISRRMVTITGNAIKNPQNVIIKIGTPIGEVIKKIGGYKDVDTVKFIAGGAMMGASLEDDELIVTKNLTGVLALKYEKEELPMTCMRCGRCVYVCPAKLSPILIRDSVKNFDGLKYLQPERCIECGLCSYICPSKIDVREAVKEAKIEIRRN